MEYTPKQKELFQEYEAGKIAILETEARLKEIKEIIYPLMKEDEKLQLTQGKIYLKAMPKWSFSPRVTALDEQLKTAKKEEQADGTAEMTPNYVLEYWRDKAKDSGVE